MALEFKNPLAARINGWHVDLLNLEKVTVDAKAIEVAKIDWDMIAEIKEFQKEVCKPKLKMLLDYEKDFLRTALLYKCTKIYIVEWTETTEAFIRYNTKFFPYQLRGDAFKLAREKGVYVQVRDIKRWTVDMSDKEFERFATHNENYELAKEVRKALKEAL